MDTDTGIPTDLDLGITRAIEEMVMQRQKIEHGRTGKRVVPFSKQTSIADMALLDELCDRALRVRRVVEPQVRELSKVIMDAVMADDATELDDEEQAALDLFNLKLDIEKYEIELSQLLVEVPATPYRRRAIANREAAVSKMLEMSKAQAKEMESGDDLWGL